MTISLVLLALIMASLIGWLLRQSLNTQPWITAAATDTSELDDNGIGLSAAKIGLLTFLTVATSLFALFLSAYATRMELADWTPLSEPLILWLNTAALVLASIALQRARNAASRDNLAAVKSGLLAGGIFSWLFLAGQLVAWRQLNTAGFYLTSNPANAFFYLFTALHGLHLLGGLWVWGKTTLRIKEATTVEELGQSVELCSLYWHFLLLVWLVLYGLLLST